jgi:hypothetical protein
MLHDRYDEVIMPEGDHANADTLTAADRADQRRVDVPKVMPARPTTRPEQPFNLRVITLF